MSVARWSATGEDVRESGTAFAATRNVTLGEFLIIYFSLGAPVAMHASLQDCEGSRALFICRALLTFALWPAALLLTIFGDKPPHIRFTNDHSNDELRSLTENLVALFKTVGKTGANDTPVSSEVRTFRELCERYAGLSHAALVTETDRASLDTVFEIAGHPNGALASICVRRRDLRRLRQHRDAAAVEFRQFVEARYEPSSELLMAAAKAAEACRDLDLFNGLLIDRESGGEAPLFNSRPPTASASRAA
ncbi:MAG: hypothetical protein ACR2IH_11175 [Pyrinomonadaceae bacterium]